MAKKLIKIKRRKPLKYLSKLYPQYKNLLKKVKVIYDANNFTDPETNTIHWDGKNDEFLIHEYGHAIGNGNDIHLLYNKYSMKPDDYNFQPGQWYADILFLTRDPNIKLGDYYDNSEVANRVRAAKYKSKGLIYNKEFFRNLRSNENLYGDNMRDLLHMYDDNTLEKVFSVEKYKYGNKLNGRSKEKKRLTS